MGEGSNCAHFSCINLGPAAELVVRKWWHKCITRRSDEHSL